MKFSNTPHCNNFSPRELSFNQSSGYDKHKYDLECAYNQITTYVSNETLHYQSSKFKNQPYSPTSTDQEEHFPVIRRLIFKL